MGLKENELHSISELHPNPFSEFSKWFTKAETTDPDVVISMFLATVGDDGSPSGRVVLLKGFDQDGFRFFTNYESRKAKELEKNNKASLVFSWPNLDLQVRIEGQAIKVSDRESDEYFASRPRGSQIGAWASAQSQVIPSREFLDKKVKEVEKKYENKEIPRPVFWGGYVVKPRIIEFMARRDSRLHDRFRYKLSQSSQWDLERLSP